MTKFRIWYGLNEFDNIEDIPILNHDHRNVKFNINSEVAYNRSGEVHIGEITDVLENKWHSNGYGYYHKFLILVKNIDDGKISRLRNVNSFICI